MCRGRYGVDGGTRYAMEGQMRGKLVIRKDMKRFKIWGWLGTRYAMDGQMWG